MSLAERPENELLVCLASPSLGGGQAERVRELLGAGIEWQYLLVMAHRHSVVPLLHHYLNSIAPEAVPAPILSRLRSRNDENTRQSLLLIGELHKLMERLKEQGIQAAPFKGPTLALIGYGDVALRQFGDLDILVRRRDVLKVKQLLVAEGFKPIPELTNAQEAALLRFDCAYNFGSEKQVLFDVHWNFAPRYLSPGIDLDRLWTRLDSITINGRELPSLAAADLLPALCLHGATHAWERLGWIADVAGLIARTTDLDWEMVLAEAAAGGNRRMLALGLWLAKDLLAAPLPEVVWQAVAEDAVVRQLAVEVKQRLFLSEPPRTGIFGEVLMQLRMRDRKRDQLRSLVRLAATPRSFDWMLLPLPAWLSALYYPWRPIRLAGKYGLKLLHGSSESAAK
jgi:Uncharacterised nucleotidyltransferase